MAFNSHRIVVVMLLTSIAGGCATRYVERDLSKDEFSDNFGDVVVSQTSEALKKKPLTCLGVLPFIATRAEYSPTDDVRKAIHAQLAPTGVRLIPLQKIDQLFKKELSTEANIAALSSANNCDTYLSGEVTERSTRFWGIYSEVKVGARLQIRQLNQGQPLWEGRHIAIVRDGGLPLNPATAVTTTISAGANLRQEQVTRTTHDLARRLVGAIPSLTFQETPLANDLSPDKDSASNSQSQQAANLASLKTELKGMPPFDVEQRLTDELSSDRWTASKEREEVAELLIAKAPSNSLGYREMAKSKLAHGQGAMAVIYGKKLVQLEPDDPDSQFLLGRAYLKAAKPDEAVQPLLKAAGADIPKPVYFTALGLSYSQQGKYALAIAAYTKALELTPDDSFALLQLGMAQSFEGDEEEAALSIRKSIVVAIASNERASAEKSLVALQSLGLENRISAEDLQALKERIHRL
jgi:Flp pilus assembly protein TadD